MLVVSAEKLRTWLTVHEEYEAHIHVANGASRQRKS
jgi:hypothetical protein